MKNKKFYVFLLVFSVLLLSNVKSNADENVSLQEMCETSSFSEIKDAIKAGANVNSKDENGRTPLMAACEYESSHEVIQLLMSFKAIVNDTDNKGYTAVMYAAKYDPYPRVIAEMVKLGADVNIKANDGTTALMLACENTKSVQVVSELIKAGANINAKDKDGHTAMDYLKKNPNSNKDLIMAVLMKAGATYK